MRLKKCHVLGGLPLLFVIACLALLLMPGIAFADEGTVDVTVYHHYNDRAAPVREDIRLEAGDYALSALVALTTDDASYVHETDGTRFVTFEVGYSYTVNIYYTRVYTVTFMLNYGTDSVHATKQLKGLLLRLETDMPPNPSRNGYTFLGWNTEADGSGQAFTSETVVEDDITVYAQWREVDAEEEAGPPPTDTAPPSALPKTGDRGLLVLPFLLIGISFISFAATLRFNRAHKSR